MGKNKKKNIDILNDALDMIINDDPFMDFDSSPESNGTKMTYTYKNNKTPSENSFMRDEINSYNYMKDIKDSDRDDPDAWMDSIIESVSFSKKRGKKRLSNIFDESFGKKKKHKNKTDANGKEVIDYNKQLEPELNMYRNLLKEQNMFTESLQKEYDLLKSSKSMTRGVNKSMSDLIANITSARALSMQLVDKNVSAKKIIAELNMKQSKDATAEGDGNMSDYAASFLRQMINERGSVMGTGANDASVTEYNDESFSDMFESQVQDSDRPDEIDRYLKYENRNVSIWIQMSNSDTENYEFVARDDNGDIIDDYPLPNKTKLSINRSTNIATDTYGKKYSIEWI